MEYTTERRGVESHQEKKTSSLKHLLMIGYTIFLLFIFYNNATIFGIHLFLIILTTIFVLPLIIILKYLIRHLKNGINKRYIGTFIWLFIFSIIAIPTFFIMVGQQRLLTVVDGNKTNNVAICGTDIRQGYIRDNSRCDSVAIINFNNSEKSLNYVSIPRDAYVYDTCVEAYDKLTHTSLESMDCFVDTIEKNLDINISGFVKADFDSVINVVDAIGGIDIAVDQPFYGQDRYDNVGAYYFEGNMHLDGAQALSYARERYAFSDGDYTRAKHQQQVLVAILNQVKSGGIKSAINLIPAIKANVYTDLTTIDFANLGINMILARNYDHNSIVMQGIGSSADLPHRDLYGVSVQMINGDSVKEVQDLLK